MATNAVNVSEIIDRRGFGSYQIWILGVCFLIALADGYDSQSIGVTAPLIAGEFHLPPALLGPIFSSAQWGSLIGSLIFGPCADRWGRRRFLVACTLLFSLATLATPFATSFETLAGIRFLTGLGLGGASPCFVALVAEYTPQRMRARIVEVLWGGLPGGGIFVGLLGAYLIADFGWRSVYWVGGVAGLLFVVLLVVRVPESLRFMALRGGQEERMRRVLARLAPGAVGPSVSRFVITEEARAGMPVKHLFTGGRGLLTVLLWLLFFTAFGALIASLVWIPTLLKQAGLTAPQAALCLALHNIGGVVGTVLSGVLIDRWGYVPLAFTFVLGTVSTALLGYAAPDFLPVATVATAAGFFLGGSASGIIVVAAQAYPTFVRSTGVGWCQGFSRLGSAALPLLIGVLVAAHFTPAQNLAVLGAIPLISAVDLLALHWLEKVRQAAAGPKAVAMP
ncbi:MAG TPA: MFS transporter [Stellaceae bacterium]|nr:MFS transporter [Stellaceae bacterium]